MIERIYRLKYEHEIKELNDDIERAVIDSEKLVFEHTRSDINYDFY